MDTKEITRKRGRPKTLDRDYVVDVSMQAYWQEGIEAVSLNKICKKAHVSKPGIYREFGSDDGLIKAVLIQYQNQVLRQIHKIFKEDKPFLDILDTYIDILTVQSPNQYGCLFIRLRDSKYPLGEESKKQVLRIQEEYLDSFTKLIKRAKEKGEFPSNISTELAVNYIDAQVGMAMTKAFSGVDVVSIKQMLKLAFSVFK